MIFELVAIAVALAGGFAMGYVLKHHRARAEGYLAGRLDERRALRQMIDALKERETPEGVSATYR